MRRLACVLVLVLVLIVSPHVFSAERYAPMTIATGVDPNFALFYVGYQGGIFKDLGLEVKLTLGASGSATVPLVISGDSNASFGGITSALSVYMQDDRLAFITDGSTLKPEFIGFLTTTDIKTDKDLLGKRIGVAPASGSEEYFLEFCRHYKYEPEQFKVIHLQAPEMLAALEKDDVDAFVSWEPWLAKTIIALKGKVHQLEMPPFFGKPGSYVFMDRTWIEANRPTALKFAEGLVKAADLLNSDFEKCAQLISEVLEMDLELCKMIMKKVDYRCAIDQLAFEKIQTGYYQALKLEVISEPETVEFWERFIYDDLMREVKPSAVSYTIKLRE